mgnify:CR=1 FL=1
MHRALRYGLVAVVVAFLSIGANALVENTPSGYNTAACASGEVSVFPDRAPGTDDPVAYERLGERERRVLDRARTRSNRTASIDPALGTGLPSGVVVNGTVYDVRLRTFGCPLVRGLPRWSNSVLFLFAGIYWVFSPLYLPGAAVLAIVVGYHYVDDWLQFG